MASTLRTHELTKSYGGRTVVRGVSLDVNAGEIYEYIGTAALGPVDLASPTVDYSDTTKWRQLRTADYEDIFFPAIGNVVTTNSKAIGLSIAYNDVRGNAAAYI